MPSLEVTSIIIALINVAGAIICALINRSQRQSQDELSSPLERVPLSRGTRIFLYLALISFGFFIVQKLFQSSQTMLEITYPQDQAAVDQCELIQGTSQAIPPESSAWLVIFSKDVGRYYPQANPLLIGADGKWSMKVFIGLDQDSGKYFDLLLVLADDSANREFLDYEKQAYAEKNWAGMEFLPAGADLYDQVTVQRR